MNCDNELSSDYTDFLVINGALHDQHRNVLNVLSINTIIISLNDLHLDLPICR